MKWMRTTSVFNHCFGKAVTQSSIYLVSSSTGWQPGERNSPQGPVTPPPPPLSPVLADSSGEGLGPLFLSGLCSMEMQTKQQWPRHTPVVHNPNRWMNKSLSIQKETTATIPHINRNTQEIKNHRSTEREYGANLPCTMKDV